MKKTILFISIFLFVLSLIILSPSASYAQPYGSGIYNESVPYGDQTSLSISTDGNVSISITPTAEGVLSKNSSVVTVSSTDVEGYKLYISSLNSTDMINVGEVLPTSSNGSPSPLSNNTWGYNLDNSNNFVGISLNETLIKSVFSPVSNDTTTITYGVKLDMAKPAGQYTANIIYTAVPQTD